MVDEAGKFIVQIGGQKKLFTHFKDLYVNRMRFEGNKKPIKLVQVEIAVAPKVSKNSEKYAKKHRAKIAGEGITKNIVEFLLAKNDVKNKIKDARKA